MKQEQLNELDKLLRSLEEEDSEELVETLVNALPAPLMALVALELYDQIATDKDELVAMFGRVKRKRKPLGQDVSSPELRQARKDFIAEHENHQIDPTRAEALTNIVRSLTQQELEDFADIIFTEMPESLHEAWRRELHGPPE